MRKFNLIISIFIVLFSITKINGIDINNELYPTSLAFDYNNENKELILYFQIINPSFLSKNENVNNFTKNSTFTIKQNGSTFYDCYNKINSITKQRISLRHIQSMILSNNIINNPNLTHNLILLLIKNHTLPSNIYIYATSDNIDDIYNNKNVMDESSYFSLLDNPQDSNIGSIIYPKTLLEAAISILDNQKMYYIPSIYLDENIEAVDGGKKNKVLNLNGCYFTSFNKYDFIFLKLDKIKGFSYFYSKNIDSLEINSINNKYFLRIHQVNSKISVEKNMNYLSLSLNEIDLLCPLTTNLEKAKKEIHNEIYKDILNLYNLSIEKNIDIFNIKDLRYRYKKSPNLMDLSIKIKTNYQTIQYYSSITT